MGCHRTKCPLLLPILSAGLVFSQKGLSQGSEILHGVLSHIKLRFGLKQDLRGPPPCPWNFKVLFLFYVEWSQN